MKGSRGTALIAFVEFIVFIGLMGRESVDGCKRIATGNTQYATNRIFEYDNPAKKP